MPDLNGRVPRGDMVPWAFCRHVYHQNCIQECLLQRKGCPSCRRTVLLADRGRALRSSLAEIAELRDIRQENTYFCIQDGFIIVTGEGKERPETNCGKATPKRKDFVHESLLAPCFTIANGLTDNQNHGT
jgi:hypothetical protein